MTSILGNSVATAYQMATFLMSKNKSPKFSRNISAQDFAQLFLDVASQEGVRGDIAFAQACKETGYFAYGGDVKYTQNNFAGLGATGGVPGNSFTTIEIGIMAQVQHLKTYATKANLNTTCVDPRRTAWFVNAKGGTSPNVETLGGTWAVPGYNTSKYSSLTAANNAKDSYGYDIVNILNTILAIKTTSAASSSYAYYTNIKAKSISYSGSRSASAIKYLVYHYTGNKTDKAVNNAKYFANTNTKKVGAHYFVDDTSVYQSIDDLKIAYSVGGSKYSDCAKTGGGTMYGKITNTNSISIEMCSTNGSFTEATLKNAAELGKSLMKKYNIPIQNVYRHHDVNGKYCPGWTGWWGSDSSKWNAFKSRLSSSSTSDSLTNTSSSTQTVSLAIDGVDMSKVFNPTDYANYNPDVKKAYGTDANKLFQHWRTYGIKEKRRTKVDFDINVYMTHPDLQNAFGGNVLLYFKHYVQYGYKENRRCV